MNAITRALLPFVLLMSTQAEDVVQPWGTPIGLRSTETLSSNTVKPGSPVNMEPQTEDSLVAGEEESVPTLPGKPFFDVSFDSFAPKGASLGPLAVTQAVGVAIGFRPLKYIQVDAFGFDIIPPGMASDGRQSFDGDGAGPSDQGMDGAGICRRRAADHGPRLTRQIEDSSFLPRTKVSPAKPAERTEFQW
jgi:hypothetical protein